MEQNTSAHIISSHVISANIISAHIIYAHMMSARNICMRARPAPSPRVTTRKATPTPSPSPTLLLIALASKQEKEKETSLTTPRLESCPRHFRSPLLVATLGRHSRLPHRQRKKKSKYHFPSRKERKLKLL